MENNKYLIALDLDGTLLNDNKEITLTTKNYLNKLEKEGNLIVICSGRAPRSIIDYYKFLDITSPIISYNGALCFDPRNDKFKTISYKIDTSFTKKLYKEIINKEVISILAEDDNHIYCDKEDDFLFAFFKKDNMEIIDKQFDENEIDSTYIFVMKMKDESEETKNSLLKKFKRIDKESKYKLRFWRDCPYCEIHFKDVSKANTLEKLRKTENIKEDNVFVFGDADNDIEMLSNYNHSYLMKNGNPKIKEYAKNITEFNNNNDGVIKELKKFFNN